MTDRILLDGEIIDYIATEKGINVEMKIAADHPAAEIIRTGHWPRESNPLKTSLIFLKPDRHLDDFNRGFHDEMTYYGPAEPRDELSHFRDVDLSALEIGMAARASTQHPVVCCVSTPLDSKAPYLVTEGERTTFRMHSYQREAVENIRRDTRKFIDIELGAALSQPRYIMPAWLLHEDGEDVSKHVQLVIDPALLNRIQRGHSKQDLGDWDLVDVPMGFSIRYKFLREDGKTHKQIRDEFVAKLSKRRKAAAKKIDYIGADYDKAIKENEANADQD